MSLVGFKAKNHPQQATRDDVDDRRAPRNLFDPLHARHRFTVDAAASPGNAMLPRYWTVEDDALSKQWGAERVWCNPPYSDIATWVEKAWLEMRFGKCGLVVMLLPANRCEQRWWQNHVEPYRDGGKWSGARLSTHFLPTRLRFDWPADRIVPAKGDRPPFGCVLLTWEQQNDL